MVTRSSLSFRFCGYRGQWLSIRALKFAAQDLSGFWTRNKEDSVHGLFGSQAGNLRDTL